MKHRPFISGRARRHFLRLAAVAFAVGGADAAPALAGDARAPDAGRRNATREAAARDYRHEIPLPGWRDSLPAAGAGATVEITPLAGGDRQSLTVSGPCCIGPMAPGAYAVSVADGSARNALEVHLLRIDAATGRHLEFTAGS